MRLSPAWAATVVVVFGLVAASCASGATDVSTRRADVAGSSEANSSDVTTPDPVSDPIVEPTPGAERAERGTLDWEDCPDIALAVVPMQCATMEVPLDHDEPASPTIDIAVARTLATGNDEDRIGSLVFNPGGPGGSGIEALGFLPLTMSDEILARFDLVSFDPRGVGASTALACDNDLDDQISLLEGGDDDGWADLVDATSEQLASCTAETLELASFVGTNNAARDMDLLRAALGDDGLSYVGYSYGTRLGATYAELFPGNVRALVLDAAVKPTRDSAELNAEQGGGFDRALQNFAMACDADTDCLLQDVGSTLDVIAGLRAEIADVGTFPTDDPERVLTPGEFDLGVVAALYSKESWPFLASALFTAETEQDGTLLQVLGDSLVGRRPDGTYKNSQIANRFITCADDPERPDADEQRRLADGAADQSTFFDDFLRASTGCLGLSPATDPLVIGPATGAAPILVIGNTGDPATPYEWSVELAASLDTAVLYTADAEGHTAYGSIECVQPTVDAYLLELAMPDADSSCSDNAGADFFVPAGESDIGQILAFFDCVRDEGADVPELSEADILADPTLETVFGELDISAPATATAFVECADLLPDL